MIEEEELEEPLLVIGGEGEWDEPVIPDTPEFYQDYIARKARELFEAGVRFKSRWP